MIGYRIDEADFEVPEHWSDRTVNIFAVGSKLPLQLSFVITRDDIDKEASLADYAEEKLGELEGKLKQFKLIEKKQLEVAGTTALDAEFKWLSDMGTMHQRQTYVRRRDRVLIFTVTAPRVLNTEQRAHVDAVLASLRLQE